MNPPRLPHFPRITFFSGGPQALRTEVANALADLMPFGQSHSFRSPVYEGILGTLFMGDPSIDVTHRRLDPVVHGISLSIGGLTDAYESFLRGVCPQPILGYLAAQRVTENLEWVKHYIFDDADHIDEIRLAADVVGRGDALIVNFGGHRFNSATIRILDVTSSDALAVIDELATLTNPKGVHPHDNSTV